MRGYVIARLRKSSGECRISLAEARLKHLPALFEDTYLNLSSRSRYVQSVCSEERRDVRKEGEKNTQYRINWSEREREGGRVEKRWRKGDTRRRISFFQSGQTLTVLNILQ